MWFSLKCFRSSSRMAEMAFTMISLCRLTSTPSFMLCSTVVLQPKPPGCHPDSAYTPSTRLLNLRLLKTQQIPAFSPSIISTKRSVWRLEMVPDPKAGNKLPVGDTYGISSGSTSARMLIESVLALEVGAAASRIFSRAIWRFQKQEKVSK